MNSKKRYIDFNEAKGLVGNIARHIQKNNYRITAVVGIVRGGLAPATMLSHYFGVPLFIIDYSLRDRNNAQTFNSHAVETIKNTHGTIGQDGHVLVVDDINDTGATIAWIKQDWQSSCLPNDDRWNCVWGHNVRFATLTNNMASKETVDYSVWEVNKAEEDCWLVYPWEDFWRNDN